MTNLLNENVCFLVAAFEWHYPFGMNQWYLASMAIQFNVFLIHELPNFCGIQDFQWIMTWKFQMMMEAEYFWQAWPLSLLTGQFVNGEEHGDSVMLQIHHNLMESRLVDQRVERRGRGIWGEKKGRDRGFGTSLEANNGYTDWCWAVEWCGNHHLCGRGDPAIALGGHAIVIWQLMSHPYFTDKC